MTIADEIAGAARAAMARWRVPASVQIAQWAIESGWGAHSPGNNPFGMKPRAGRGDPQQMLMTREYAAGRGYYRVPQPFRIFASIAAAFDAHGELLATARAYAAAMAALPDVSAFVDRMAPRYATDPHYAAKLKSLIAAQQLTRFDAALPVTA